MLTRAARRRQALRYAQNAARGIELRFLCPILSVTHINATQQRPISSRPLSKTRIHQSRSPQARQLASAAPLPESNDWHDDYIPYLYGRNPPSQSGSQPVSTTLPDWDPSLSNLLYIDASTLLPYHERINTNLQLNNDIRGNSNELEDNLEACVALKKWPRAIKNLEQLKILYHTDTERLRQQYDYVLAALVDEFAESGSAEAEERITQWIDREMRQAQLEPSAQTLALVIKSALVISAHSKRDRVVRRYWDMAKRFNLHGEVGNLRDILTERDLGLISQICPLEAQAFANFLSDQLPDDEPEIFLSGDVVAQRAEVGILQTEQKGQGMSTLKKTLSLFDDEQDQLRMRSSLTQEARKVYARQRQARIEHDAITSATERWKTEHRKMARLGITAGLNSGHLGALMWQWHEVMRDKIIAEVKLVEEAEKKVKKTAQDKLRLEYGPFLQQLEPSKLAAATAIAMMQIMNKVGTARPVKLVRLVMELGKIIESERHAEVLHIRALKWKQKRRKGEPLAEIVKNLIQNPERPDNWGVTSRGNHPASQKYLRTSEWTSSIHVKLGAILAELFMDSARVSVSHKNEKTGKTITIAQPIFVRQKVFSGGKKIGTVSLHESFLPQLVRQPRTDLIAKQLPMVCEPLPWKNFTEGGYLETRVPVLRVKNREALQKDYVDAAANNGDLDQVFAGLDVLGKVPWKINKKVFEVMIQAWNSKEDIAGLAPLDRQVEIPERPPADAPNRAKYDWFSRMREIDNQKNGDHSERCFQNLQIEIARAYLNETFYLPHNMDFRGRAYPIPPYLNQMGADSARGLLLFGKGRQLGPRGLWWLKIHLSNVYGYDKASLSDRAEFPMTHLDDIKDSVERPFDGKRWWLSAEDPWQCLAACQEFVQALELSNPEEYVSHLPVHQDGSCNGLQHYAALGGDVDGARQVNLEPGDKPADVYTGVCDLVAVEVAADAKQGHPMAQLLDGRLKRKIVKQTVMTNVYGVTFIGAAAQVRKQIDALLPDILEKRLSGRASLYVAEKIFRALGKLFNGAHSIQYWLGDCANRISSSISPAQLDRIAQNQAGQSDEGAARPGRRKPTKKASATVKQLKNSEFRSSVIWTTPLKLPVVQPYRKAKGAAIQTALQQITLFEPTIADAVDRRKQLQAFPPNFIHSLDATHMILSALKSDELGLSFAAVHDSFWTHAADVDVMSRLLRDAFIRMHSEDIIGRLGAEFNKRYEGYLYMAQINKTSPLARALKDYRKSHGRKSVTSQKNAELLREIEKRQLMASADASERERGEQMITAATLFKQYNGERYLSSKDSLGQTAIAEVPKAATEVDAEAALADISLNSESLADAEDELDVEHTEYLAETDPSEEDTLKRGDPKKRKSRSIHNNNQTWAWLPLTFRDVPKKGDFDVRRLKDSQYFFS